MGNNRLSIYLSYLLRHNPGELNLDMDKHGWVSVKQLIDTINQRGKYTIDNALLNAIVVTDKKGVIGSAKMARRLRYAKFTLLNGLNRSCLGAHRRQFCTTALQLRLVEKSF